MDKFPGNTFVSESEMLIQLWQLPVHRSPFQNLA